MTPPESATPNPNAAPPAVSLSTKLGVLAGDIKLSHTVFALPFALLSMVLASGWAQRRPTWSEVGLIVLCMVTARTFAMCVNRLADAEIDAQNPRTAKRAVAAGTVSRGLAGVTILITALGFVAAAAGFWWLRDNPWPVGLALPVLGVLAGYSLTKRFTWLCHVVLGLALALSPLAAALAIEPGYLGLGGGAPLGSVSGDLSGAGLTPGVEVISGGRFISGGDSGGGGGATPWLIAGMVLCWVAGFDVIYALQDVSVDRKLGLFSMPASLGVEPALWISRALHAAAVACLVLACWLSPQLGVLFACATALTAGLLVLEHALVWRSATHRIHLAFFTVNGVISLLLGGAGILDSLLR